MSGTPLPRAQALELMAAGACQVAYDKSDYKFCTKSEWRQVCAQASKQYIRPRSNTPVPTKYETYRLKQMLQGLVLGPLDKNGGETWAMCPILYQEGLTSLYNKNTGYAPIHPWKCSANQCARWKCDITKHCINPNPPPQISKGSKMDIVKAWKHVYTTRKWKAYGSFNTKGDINVPYVLLKAKKVVDPVVRQLEYKKMRPIAPSTKHPLSQVLHRAGRAWYFLSTVLPGEHFVLNRCDEVPKKLDEANKKFEGHIAILNQDIEGCFPNMPQNTIKEAARWACQAFAHSGLKGVWVPKQGKKLKCTFAPHHAQWKYIWMPFSALLELLDFSLDNALVEMPNGDILKQRIGVPMGGAISPGATVITLAFMEQRYLASISTFDKENLIALRYMDDLLTVIHTKSNHIVETYKNVQIYEGDLRLETTTPFTFLETWLEVNTQGKITYRLKNDNEWCLEPKIWRYQHWHSGASYTLKRGILLATLKKVDRMASDPSQLFISATEKIREFSHKQYPPGTIGFACNVMYNTTGNWMWKRIKAACGCFPNIS